MPDMQAATSTVLEHTNLLLLDVAHQSDLIRSSWRGAEVDPGPEMAETAAHLARRLDGLRTEYGAVAEEATRLCSSRLALDCGPARAPDPQLNAMQLDTVVKAVGQAHFALMQAMHKWVEGGVSEGRVCRNRIRDIC
jgi:hypothetical protein